MMRGIYAIWWGTNVFVKIFVKYVAFTRGFFKFFLKLVKAVIVTNFCWIIYTVEEAPIVSFLMGILNNEGL